MVSSLDAPLTRAPRSHLHVLHQVDLGRAIGWVSRPNTPSTIPCNSGGIWTEPVYPRNVPPSLAVSWKNSTPNTELMSAAVPARRTVLRAGLDSTTSTPCWRAKASTFATSAGSAPYVAANSSRLRTAAPGWLSRASSSSSGRRGLTLTLTSIRSFGSTGACDIDMHARFNQRTRPPVAQLAQPPPASH